MVEGQMCKVDYIIDRYELSAPGSNNQSLDEYLISRWTGRDGEAVGYKELTSWFNKRLLKQVYERNGRETIGTRVDSEYQVLNGDDELIKEEVMDDIESDGINAESLVNDMVSWSTMRRHLKNCLKAKKPASRSPNDWEFESVNIARQQTKAKAKAALRSLGNKQRLPHAEKAIIEVQIKLSCPECPTRIPFEDAIDRGFICNDHLPDTSTSSLRSASTSELD